MAFPVRPLRADDVGTNILLALQGSTPLFPPLQIGPQATRQPLPPPGGISYVPAPPVVVPAPPAPLPPVDRSGRPTTPGAGVPGSPGGPLPTPPEAPGGMPGGALPAMPGSSGVTFRQQLLIATGLSVAAFGTALLVPKARPAVGIGAPLALAAVAGYQAYRSQNQIQAFPGNAILVSDRNKALATAGILSATSALAWQVPATSTTIAYGVPLLTALLSVGMQFVGVTK
jgi:hypothetical protein